MPNEAKVKDVADLAEKFSRSTLVISTDFTGLTVRCSKCTPESAER